MARLDLSSLRSTRPVVVPDPAEKVRTLAALRAEQQAGQLRDVQIRHAEQQMSTETADRTKAEQQAAQIQEILKANDYDFAKSIRQIGAIVPGAAKLYQDILKTQSEITNQAAQLDETQRLRAVQEAAETRQANAPRVVGRSLVTPEGTPIYTDPPQNIGQDNEYERWVSQQPQGADTSVQAYWKARTMATDRPLKTMPGAKLPLYDPQGRVTASWDTETGAITPADNPEGARRSAVPSEVVSKLSALDAVDSIINDIEFYSKKIHTSGGLGARVGGLLRRGAAAAGYDADVTSLRSKAGEISQLIRTLGESGALSTGDVTRALALLPLNPGATQTEAQQMIRDLRNIIKVNRQAYERRVGLGAPSIPPPPPAATHRFNPATGQIEPVK